MDGAGLRCVHGLVIPFKKHIVSKSVLLVNLKFGKNIYILKYKVPSSALFVYANPSEKYNISSH